MNRLSAAAVCAMALAIPAMPATAGGCGSSGFSIGLSFGSGSYGSSYRFRSSYSTSYGRGYGYTGSRSYGCHRYSGGRPHYDTSCHPRSYSYCRPYTSHYSHSHGANCSCSACTTVIVVPGYSSTGTSYGTYGSAETRYETASTNTSQRGSASDVYRRWQGEAADRAAAEAAAAQARIDAAALAQRVELTPAEPVTDRDRLDEAWASFADGNARVAQRAFGDLAQQDPGDAWAKVGFAVASLELDQPRAALWALRRAYTSDSAAQVGYLADPDGEITARLDELVESEALDALEPGERAFAQAVIHRLRFDDDAALAAIDRARLAGDTHPSLERLSELIEAELSSIETGPGTGLASAD